MASRRFQFFVTTAEFKDILVPSLDAESYLLFHYWPQPEYRTAPLVGITDEFEQHRLYDILVSPEPFNDIPLDMYAFEAVDRGLLDIIAPNVSEGRLLAADIAVGSAYGVGGERNRLERAVERYEQVVKRLKPNLRLGVIDCQTGNPRRSIGYSPGARLWFEEGGQLCDSGDTTKCYRL